MDSDDSDTIFGGAGDDTLFGDDKDSLNSGHGQDVIFGGGASDFIDGFGQADLIYGDDSVANGTGVADNLLGNAGIGTIFGGEGKDTLKGTPTTTLFWEAWAMI